MKKILFSLAFLSVAAGIRAQQLKSAQEMVAITPVVCDAVSLPADAKAALNMKMTQMVTQNGMGARSGQFALTPNVVTLDKQATATAPAQYVVEFEVSFYLLDTEEQIILDETSFVVKGVDRLEHKAAIQAIHSINPRSPEVRRFMNGCREKVIEYYDNRIPKLITKAQAMAERRDFESALWVLASIPDVVDQYAMVEDQMTDIYLRQLNYNAQLAIREAKAKMSSGNYDSALAYLCTVDPFTDHNEEAVALVRQLGEMAGEREKEKLAEETARFEQERAARQRAGDAALLLRQAALQAGLAAANETDVRQSTAEWFSLRFGR